MTHTDLRDNFGVGGGVRLNLTSKCINVSLAGGAKELLCEDEQIEQFFIAHGYPGATLFDKEVLAKICDTTCERISLVPAIMKAVPGAEIFVDIDPRIDWETETQYRTDELNNLKP